MKKGLFGAFATATFLGLATIMPSLALAQSTGPNLTASSTAGKVGKGAQFEVAVYAESPEPVTIAQALISYDSTKLSLNESISYEDSPLDRESPDNVKGENWYQISRFKMGDPYPKGKFLLATLTFTALGDNGSAVVGIDAGDSAIFVKAPAGSNQLDHTIGVAVDLAAPSDTPYPGTSVAVSNGQGSQELVSTPPLSQGNNGKPIPVDNLDDSETANFAERTLERTKSVAGKDFDAASDKSDNNLVWLLLGGGALLALALVTFVLFRRRNKVTSAVPSAMPKPNSEGAVKSMEPTIITPDHKEE